MYQFGAITEEGFRILSQALTGRRLTFTKMEYGSGVLEGMDSATDKNSLREMLSKRTELVHKEADIDITDVEPDGQTTRLIGQVNPLSFSVGFSGRELGVYAQIDDELPVLYSYYTAMNYFDTTLESPDCSSFVSTDAVDALENRVRIYVVTSNAPNITVVISQEVYASKEDFEKFKEDSLAQAALVEKQLSEVVSGKIAGCVESDCPYKFNYVINSNEKLEAFANWNATEQGALTRVLITAGTYSLQGKGVNLFNAGTEFITGKGTERTKIFIKDYDRGFMAEDKLQCRVENVTVECSSEENPNEAAAGVFYRVEAKHCVAIASNKDCNNPVGFNMCDTEDCCAIVQGDKHPLGFAGCEASNCVAITDSNELGTALWESECEGGTFAISSSLAKNASAAARTKITGNYYIKDSSYQGTDYNHGGNVISGTVTSASSAYGAPSVPALASDADLVRFVGAIIEHRWGVPLGIEAFSLYDKYAGVRAWWDSKTTAPAHTTIPGGYVLLSINKPDTLYRDKVVNELRSAGFTGGYWQWDQPISSGENLYWHVYIESTPTYPLTVAQCEYLLAMGLY